MAMEHIKRADSSGTATSHKGERAQNRPIRWFGWGGDSEINEQRDGNKYVLVQNALIQCKINLTKKGAAAVCSSSPNNNTPIYLSCSQ